MKTFKIEYFVSGTTTATDWIWLTTDDKKSNGEKIRTLADALEYFRELAAELWEPNENRKPIRRIIVATN